MASSSQRTRKRVTTEGGAPSSGENWVKPLPGSAASQAGSSGRPSSWIGPLRRAARMERKYLAASSAEGGAHTAASGAAQSAAAPSTNAEGRRRRMGRAFITYVAELHFNLRRSDRQRMVSEPVPALEGSAPVTPMLRQYHEAKAQARDALLLFRLGDFYELFYEDAKIASHILGITLTSRAKGDDRVPMAGVPYHAARQYIARLVAAGHKVAICDQVEEPGPGKQLVRREIVRLVTPGTLLDEDHLEARTALWLASIAVDGPRAALALLDASTGELRALPAGSFESVVDELSRARPREVLLPEDLLGTPAAASVRRASGAVRVEGRPARSDAEPLLRRHLGVATLDGYGIRDPLVISAAAEALAYLQETQRSAARHVVGIAVEHPADALWIDPSAVQNLE